MLKKDVLKNNILNAESYIELIIISEELFRLNQVAAMAPELSKKIHQLPVDIATPNLLDFYVYILSDTDNYEMCHTYIVELIRPILSKLSESINHVKYMDGITLYYYILFGMNYPYSNEVVKVTEFRYQFMEYLLESKDIYLIPFPLENFVYLSKMIMDMSNAIYSMAGYNDFISKWREPDEYASPEYFELYNAFINQFVISLQYNPNKVDENYINIIRGKAKTLFSDRINDTIVNEIDKLGSIVANVEYKDMVICACINLITSFQVYLHKMRETEHDLDTAKMTLEIELKRFYEIFKYIGSATTNANQEVARKTTADTVLKMCISIMKNNLKYTSFNDLFDNIVHELTMKAYESYNNSPEDDNMIYHLFEDIIALEAEESSEEDEEENEGKEKKDEPSDDVEIIATQSKGGHRRSSKAMKEGSDRVYKMFKKYKNSEDKIDSQLSKIISSIKKTIRGDKTDEILGNGSSSPVSILKRVLATGAIFSFSKIGAILYLITGGVFAKKQTEKQRKEILSILDAEIEIITEKIEDARGDGNKEAKYNMMRTKGELLKARDKVKYGLSTSEKAMDTAKKTIEKYRKR